MVQLEAIIHREALCIAVKGKYDGRVYSYLRTIPQMVFSSTHRCFYARFSPALLEQLRVGLSAVDSQVDDRWDESVRRPEIRRLYLKEFITLPPSYKEQLIKRRYSEATADNYEAQFRAFLSFIHPKTAEEFSENEIHAYQLHLVQERKVSYSTQNQAINAIKFYLEQVKGGERKVYYIERPRKESKLPTVLSEEEMWALLSRTHYLKHKCMLLLLYSAGLRRSELLRLQERDLDLDRKVIHVRAAKGKKDRVTMLSPYAYQVLQDYLAQLKPKFWLFEGPDGRPYSASSLGKIIKRSAEKAGIKKNVSAHTLRHSFATHSLEQGMDLRYIQSLLGHENSKTTERYTQVTTKGFGNLVSPLDRLVARLGSAEGKDKKDI